MAHALAIAGAGADRARADAGADGAPARRADRARRRAWWRCAPPMAGSRRSRAAARASSWRAGWSTTATRRPPAEVAQAAAFRCDAARLHGARRRHAAGGGVLASRAARRLRGGGNPGAQVSPADELQRAGACDRTPRRSIGLARTRSISMAAASRGSRRWLIGAATVPGLRDEVTTPTINRPLGPRTRSGPPSTEEAGSEARQSPVPCLLNYILYRILYSVRREYTAHFIWSKICP